MIALGVIAAVWLLGRRLESKGQGTREDASAIAVWAVIAGVIGSRLYHVATDWDNFKNDLGRIPQLWRGGLGIPGGILFGALVAVWAFRRRGIPPAVGLSAAAPALPLAQAIGRWGNWWNQELFGRATTLPWGLRIDTEHLPAGYAPGTTFHPTFLYETGLPRRSYVPKLEPPKISLPNPAELASKAANAVKDTIFLPRDPDTFAVAALAFACERLFASTA